MRFSLLVLALTAAGCAGLDPWNDFDLAVPPPPAPSDGRAAGLRGRTLGLAECVRVAVEGHPAAQGSRLAARAAAARVGEARAAYFPEAALRAEAARSDGPEFRDEGRSPRNDFGASFGLRHLLYDGGRREAGLRAARADLAGANFRHDARLQQVVIAVQVSYHERLAAAALARVAEDTVRQARIHVDLARARHAAGVAARFDLLKAETEKADADLALVRARSGVRVSQGRLAQAMGLRPDEAFEIEDVSEESRTLELEEIRDLLAEAERSRPELRAARAEIEARRAEVRAARGEFLPRITAAADYGWRDSDAPPDRKEWFVGIGVEIPLFSGFASSYRLDRAAAETARASADLHLARRDVELEVWVAHSRLTEAGEAIGAAEKLVASAEESARVAEGMYRAGAGSIIELTESLTSRTAARTRLVQSRLDWRTALARLERAVGRTMAAPKP